MPTNNQINDAADRIAFSVINDQTGGNPKDEYLGALKELAKACALLTSISKDEREQGKTLVRRWKNGNRFNPPT